MSHCWYDKASPQTEPLAVGVAAAAAAVAAIFATLSGRMRSVPPFVPCALVGVTCGARTETPLDGASRDRPRHFSGTTVRVTGKLMQKRHWIVLREIASRQQS